MSVMKNLLLISLAILSTACAHAQFDAPSRDSTIQAEFPALWMEQMLFAYRDFRSTRQDASCFDVKAYRENERYYVSFLSKNSVKIVGDDIRITLGGASECGKGISYEFDGDGQFVKRIYSR